MSRSWWLQAVLYTLLVGGAIIVLLPTLLPDEDQPELVRRHWHNRIQLGLDLSGGVRLVYEIDMERAISLHMDSVARALATPLQDKYPQQTIKVVRDGNADIVVSSPPGSKLAYRHLMEAGGGWLTEVDRSDSGVRLRFDPGRNSELRESSIRAAMEIIESRMDASHCWGENLERQGDRIVLNLPGAQAANVGRIESIISRRASVRLVVADDNPDYIRKIAAAIPPDSGIELVTEAASVPGARPRLTPEKPLIAPVMPKPW